jgi:cobalt-zinc-cadmium efflux system outer membrane protein
MALARQKAGAASALDVNLSRGFLLEAQMDAESARLAAADARRRLARLLGITVNAAGLVLLDRLPEVPPELPRAERLIELACVYCLDMQAARQAVDAAKAKLEEEYRRIFPTLEIGLALERGERQSQGGRDILADTARASIANGALTAPKIQPRSERRRNTGFIIGPSVDLELPIFDQNQAQIAKARYAYERAVKTAEALRLAAYQEVRSSLDQVLTAWRLAQRYRDQSLPLAQNNLELSRQAYRAGQASFLAVLEAERFSLNSRSRAAEARRDAATTVANMERTMCMPFDKLLAQARTETQPTTQPSTTDNGAEK